MTEPLLAPGRDPRGGLGPNRIEQDWEGLAAAAAAAYDAGAFVECARWCRKGAALLGQFEKADPWRASTLNNLGIAALLDGDFSAACRRFAEAGDAWRWSKGWVGRMMLESRGRSSLFHLRLEQKNRRAFDPILRARQFRCLTAARAASLFNRALTLTHCGRATGLARALEVAQRQRLRALGARNPEAADMAMLRAELAAAQGDAPTQARLLHEAEEIQRAPARSAFESWQQMGSPTKSDERHLLAAVHLTIVVTPESLEQGLSTNSKGHLR